MTEYTAKVIVCGMMMVFVGFMWHETLKKIN
jgi:hypothetical protein